VPAPGDAYAGALINHPDAVLSLRLELPRPEANASSVRSALNPSLISLREPEPVDHRLSNAAFGGPGSQCRRAKCLAAGTFRLLSQTEVAHP
jgi:hypothetical protein